MLKKMTSSDSMMNSAENNKGEAGFIRFLASMPLSCKLFLLAILALIPRIIVFLQPQIITIDGTQYVKMAKLFSEGEYVGIPRSYFTLYPILISIVQRLTGEWEFSGKLISITLGTLTVIPIFLLGRSLYNEKVGWLVAFLYIALPNFLKFDSQVLRDPTSWFFIVVTLWLVWEGLKRNRLILLSLASISAGLGAFTRVDCFILWGTLVLYLAFQKAPKVSLKRRGLNIAILALLFPLLLSPIFLSIESDSSRLAIDEMVSFSFNVTTSNTRVILRPQEPIDAMGPKTYDSLPSISQHSLELASRHRIILAISEVIHKFIKSANLLIVLILLGLWKRKKEGFESSDWYLLCVFTALFIMSVFYARQIYYFSTRHGLTLVLPCLFFAGHGLDAAVGILSRGMERLGSGWAAIRRYLPLIIAFLFITIFLSQALGGKGEHKTVLKEAGLWLKENGFQGSVVMGPKKFLRMAFYAEGQFVEIPDSWEKVSEALRKNAVRIVAIDSCTIDQDCPGFLENWSQAGLLQGKAFKREKEQCAIQIYEVPGKTIEKTGQVK